MASAFGNLITADGSSGFKAESGRYHLYYNPACPFAARAVIARKLKGLEDVISLSSVAAKTPDHKSWPFSEEHPDPIGKCSFLSDVYFKANPDYKGRFTVPVLWDKQKNTIVNNDSAKLMRMLNNEFDAFCKTKEQVDLDLYPKDLQQEIDALNEWITPSLNTGVYRVLFSTSQEQYDTAVKQVFEGLDKVESILSEKRYLTGSTVTEADIRLFNTLIRFDHVYHILFKCNKKRIVDYPNMWGYVRDIYQYRGIGETVEMDALKYFYQESFRNYNPNGIIAIGPDIDFNSAHGREKIN